MFKVQETPRLKLTITESKMKGEKTDGGSNPKIIL